MTNAQKYKNKILEIKKDDACKVFIIPNVLRSNNLDCDSLGTCDICRLFQMIWLQEEYKESEVDWSSVAVDTPVLVSNDAKCWVRRYFARYENGKIYVWSNGRTKWSTDSYCDVSCWEYAKLAEDKE